MSTTDHETAEDVPAATAPVPTAAGGEIVADSFGEYLQARWKQIRSGESGVLPVIIGLIIIVIVFQAKNGKFLSHGNLVQLLEQAAVFIMLGMAEIFVLLLGDIDLSIGFNAGVGAIITAWLAAPPHNASWIVAIIAGVAVSTAIGLVTGLIIVLLDLPSFIVTLAGYLGLQGLIIWLLNQDPHASGGSIGVSNSVINDIINGSLSKTGGWIVMIVLIALYGLLVLARHRRRKATGLVTPPLPLTLIKIAGMAVAGVVVVIISNQNRGFGLATIVGVPWVVLVILAVLAVYTFMLNRLRFGRYMYAMGGNKEAARRAGINVNRIRLAAFVLAGFTAGIAGVLYESQLGSISSNIDGGTLVLYAVAAAVIGGTSLFGGRGKMVHAVLGGIIIAAIANGMGLLNLTADAQYMVNAGVLLAAVAVDALAHRGNRATK